MIILKLQSLSRPKAAPNSPSAPTNLLTAGLSEVFEASAFPELTPLKLKNHTNLQLGDSGIAQTVGEIMRKEFTPRAKSPVSAYNYMWKYLETLSKGTPYKYKKLL